MEAPATGAGIAPLLRHAFTHNLFSLIKLIMLDHLPVTTEDLVQICDCKSTEGRNGETLTNKQRPEISRQFIQGDEITFLPPTRH